MLTMVGVARPALRRTVIAPSRGAANAPISGCGRQNHAAPAARAQEPRTLPRAAGRRITRKSVYRYASAPPRHVIADVVMLVPQSCRISLSCNQVPTLQHYARH